MTWAPPPSHELLGRPDLAALAVVVAAATVARRALTIAPDADPVLDALAGALLLQLEAVETAAHLYAQVSRAAGTLDPETDA